ncbi:MAG: glycoside hydrolase family 13 protein [Alistipes sp.]|nr:glycoside hydrolase family 13 protein [Alistipes sp.]
MTVVSCTAAEKFDPASVADAEHEVTRVEPLSWWVGMNTPLQLLVQGEGISEYTPTLEGGGARIKQVHKAESPNYLFLDVEIDASAEPGTRYLVFTRGEEQFKVAYELDARREGSRERQSFTTADAIYLLMPDRFADGNPEIDSTEDTLEKADRKHLHGRHGGDLQGMIDHLDYIADLGMTAIWSTPLLLDNEPMYSYHGYACADYYHIDPRMGTNELYREYVAEAHKRDLKIIMDIVTNHCGMAHWWMEDLPFADWIHQFPTFTRTNALFSTNMDPNASQYDLKLQESGWFDTSMPDMNLDNPYLLQYFKQWAVWWIEWADLDGLRVDTYPYNEKQPMSAWCEAVLAEYPNLNIVGECWTGDIPQLAYWQGGNPNKDGFDTHLPSIMDFPLRDAMCAALSTDSVKWDAGMIRIYNTVADDFVYHDLSKMMIFSGNHDTDRTADVLKGNVGRMKIAMALLATMRGYPQIYTGDELMIRSVDLKQGHGGLRVDTPGGWEGDKVNLFTEEGRTGDVKELFDFTRKIFQWRKTKEVIHAGKTLHFVDREHNTYAFFRYTDQEAVFVFANNSRGKKAVPWSHYAEIASTLKNGRNVLTGEPIEMSDQTTVPARGVLVVEFER